MTFDTLFGLMVFGHMLADYPLQGDFLARAKNRFNPIPGVPWFDALLAHSVIHGGIVGLITGSVWLAIAETVIHALIDDTKCRGWISYRVDQLLHIACKILWALLVTI